jgi:hypothetical protein
MLTEAFIIENLSFALLEPELNISSNSSNTPNWDSLGQLSILATLSKITEKQSDLIAELPKAESLIDILSLLRKHQIVK